MPSGKTGMPPSSTKVLLPPDWPLSFPDLLTAPTMTITLNGQKREFSAPLTLTNLLESLDLAGKPVVVEQNQTALLPKEISTTQVQDGDVIEIVQITAGG
jgi:sulfur carrier protein